ncbi:class I lanthipeptide [Aquimarina megaterium]|uniref:class I lanthipeptide n=1 Tax=Aquimarina megaterium TaxID=1443666 RepID=UPI001C2FCCED
MKKKLVLNKKTISALNDKHLLNIRAGGDAIEGDFTSFGDKCGKKKTCNSKCNTCCPPN